MQNQNQPTDTNTFDPISFVVLLGLFMIFLLFPSLKKVKSAQIELDTISPDPQNLRLETVFGDVYTSKPSSISR